MTDTTMRALMDVYRTDVNDRDSEIDLLTQRLDAQLSLAERLDREKSQAERLGRAANDRARENLEKATELDEQVAKLNGIIESLNIDLGNEREAHTAARDQIIELRHHIDQFQEGMRRILDVVHSERDLPTDRKVIGVREILDEFGFHESVHPVGSHEGEHP